MIYHRASNTPGSSRSVRMPAEWEPQACVWLCTPHNVETWPGCMDEAVAQFKAFESQLRYYVEVRNLVDLDVPTDDSWVRDYGPIFMIENPAREGSDEKREGMSPSAPSLSRISSPKPQAPSFARLICCDFIFDGWGRKYRSHPRDNKVTTHIASLLDIQRRLHPKVLEGGAIDVDGRGTVLLGEHCARRMAGLAWSSKKHFESGLNEQLGTSHVLWIPGLPIRGDDTDGHVDNLARFVSENVIVAARAPADHADHIRLEANWKALELARDRNGHRWDLIALPTPRPVYYDFPSDCFGDGGREPLPASYANFLITNGAVFVPVFGQHADDEAVRILESIFSDRDIVGVRCDDLVVGQGAVHCLTMNQPAT